MCGFSWPLGTRMGPSRVLPVQSPGPPPAFIGCQPSDRYLGGSLGSVSLKDRHQNLPGALLLGTQAGSACSISAPLHSFP